MTQPPDPNTPSWAAQPPAGQEPATWGRQPPPPGYGYPPPPGASGHAQHQPPKKRSSGKIAALGCAGVIGLFVIIGIATAVAGAGNDTKPSSVAAADNQDGSDTSQHVPARTKSAAAQFKAYVADNGTASEKAAVKHVVKIQGADSKNDILDSAEIHTDFKGDLMSGDAAKGKLLASAFADWQQSRGKDSKNGLVTVYNDGGEILSNGKY